MRIVLDAGAFVALERRDIAMRERFALARQSNTEIITHGGVVAQVWRGGSGRQALVASALHAVKVVPLDLELGRAAGLLISQSGVTDAVDAAVVALARDEDRIITSDPSDLARLIEASGKWVNLIPT